MPAAIVGGDPLLDENEGTVKAVGRIDVKILSAWSFAAVPGPSSAEPAKMKRSLSMHHHSLKALNPIL